VVITRARHRLWITYANTRYKFGQIVQNEPSRFIEEIPEASLDRSFAGGGAMNQGSSRWGQSRAGDRMKGWGLEDSGRSAKNSGRYFNESKEAKSSNPPYLAPKSIQQKVVEHVASADFVASDVSDIEAGQRIEHQKFGYGEVMKIEGSAHNPVATVKFENNGEKKIMLNYARLRIVPAT
jgi:DNA helicase-2/ATP-dependent DNA helicase PcrA